MWSGEVRVEGAGQRSEASEGTQHHKDGVAGAGLSSCPVQATPHPIRGGAAGRVWEKTGMGHPRPAIIVTAKGKP